MLLDPGPDPDPQGETRYTNRPCTTPKAQGGKNMSSGGFASRAQSAADRNTQGSSSKSNTNSASGNGQQSKSGQK